MNTDETVRVNFPKLLTILLATVVHRCNYCFTNNLTYVMWKTLTDDVNGGLYRV